jgi:hypothetical protein
MPRQGCVCQLMNCVCYALYRSSGSWEYVGGKVLIYEYRSIAVASSIVSQGIFSDSICRECISYENMWK